MSQVFISYSHQDRACAEALRDELHHRGIEAWMDDALQPGELFRRAIPQELDQAERVIVLWSRHSVHRTWVLDEADNGLRRGILLPVCIEELDPEEIPMGFRQLQTLDLIPDVGNGQTFDKVKLKRLIEAIESRLPAARNTLRSAGDTILGALREALTDRYQLLHELGRGGLAIVYKARSVTANSLVAIKVTTTQATMFTKGVFGGFVSAKRISDKLRHENIASVHTVEQNGELFLMVMPFIDGVGLDSILRGNERLPADKARPIILQLAQGLAYAHRRGVVHGNLIPSNVLVRKDGRVFIKNFGMTDYADFPRHRRSDLLSGTPTYLSPEQCLGKPATYRSDQYSLGVIAYEMLAGRPPYSGESPYEVMRQHCRKQRPAKLPRDCPGYLKDVVMRCLATDPLGRYTTLPPAILDLQETCGDCITPLAIARASYHRCQIRTDMLDIFYERFINSNATVKERFRDIDVTQQIHHLDDALRLILRCGIDSQEVRRQLDRIAAGHQAFPRQLYDLFTAALLDAVRECDAGCDPQVEKAWEEVIGACVDYLLRDSETESCAA